MIKIDVYSILFYHMLYWVSKIDWRHTLSLIQQAAKDTVIAKAKIVIPEKRKVCRKAGFEKQPNIKMYLSILTKMYPLLLPA